MFQVADHNHQTGPPNVADPQPWKLEAWKLEAWKLEAQGPEAQQQREPWEPGDVRAT